MSTVPHEPKTVGPYLASLQSLFEGKQTRMDWLIVAHNDPVMVRRLSEVIDDNSAAMLQIQQSNWDFGGSDFLEAVTWSISEAGVKHLLLVGHSQGGPPEQAATWIGDGLGTSDPTDSTQSSYDRLLDGAKRVQDQIQRSKDHFAEQIIPLGEIEEVQDALVDGRLQLHTLFYVAQNSTFLRFDIVNQTFKPLGG